MWEVRLGGWSLGIAVLCALPGERQLDPMRVVSGEQTVAVVWGRVDHCRFGKLLPGLGQRGWSFGLKWEQETPRRRFQIEVKFT